MILLPHQKGARQGGKYFGKFWLGTLGGFIFEGGVGNGEGNGEGERMERYIHTIHAPADIFQGGVFTICSLFVLCSRFVPVLFPGVA